MTSAIHAARPADATGRSVQGHRRADLINAATVLGIGLVLLAFGAGGPDGLSSVVEVPSPWWHAVPLVLACGVIAVQSSWPMWSFVAATALLVIDMLFGMHVAVVLAWSNGVYAVYRYTGSVQRRRVTIGLLVALIAFAPLELLAGADSGVVFVMSLQLGAFAALAAWWGSDVRAGHELAALETERAADIARIARLEQAEAVREERVGMARDLHDLVSSHLSAIAIHASAALQLEPDVVRDRRVLGEVRTESVAALEEMRRLIHLLRADEVARDLALDDAASLPAIVERFRVAGLDVDADIDAGQIAPHPGRVLTLIAREALTNALKHGTGTARLQLEATAEVATLIVENATDLAGVVRASGPHESGADIGAGIGLDAMRERAVAIGGSVDVQRDDDGCTWTVRARVPNDRSHKETT